MSGSLLVAVKAALVDLLPLQPALYGVQVQWADEAETARRERIYLGDVEDDDHEPVALRAGRRLRHEDATLRLYVEVIGQKGYRQADERAMAIAKVVEEFLADDPKIGDVPGLLFAVVGGVTLSTTMTTEGPRSLVEVRIVLKGRLL